MSIAKEKPFHEFTHNEDFVKPFCKHLGSINGKVTIVDEDLGRCNFRHAGERLCELWECDKIN
ncbi:22073_t:CDS:2, partial [Rhizophagus irregularis]